MPLQDIQEKQVYGRLPVITFQEVVERSKQIEEVSFFPKT
jgi:hypothetical protein